MNINNRRRGFSLIAVLVISLAGMALLGGLFYTFQSMSGRTQDVMSQSTTYNTLQDGVEQGKAFLKDEMMKGTEALWWSKSGEKSKSIKNVSDLLICSVSSTGAKTPIGHVVKSADVKVGADKGVLNVYIYDMQYEPDDIDPDIAPAARAELPPMMSVNSGGGGGSDMEGAEASDTDAGGDEGGGPSINAGAYVIRATLTRANGEAKTIETAVVQAAGE
jgi:hypothetical protein